MGAAYLAILIAIGYYLFCLDSPDMNPLDLSLVSSFRALLLKHTPWLLPTTDRKRARLERVLAEVTHPPTSLLQDVYLLEERQT